jgi:hypothetical protein
LMPSAFPELRARKSSVLPSPRRFGLLWLRPKAGPDPFGLGWRSRQLHHGCVVEVGGSDAVQSVCSGLATRPLAGSRVASENYMNNLLESYAFPFITCQTALESLQASAL